MIGASAHRMAALTVGHRHGDETPADERPADEHLYALLRTQEYDEHPFSRSDLGEGMTLVSQVIDGYWKPRYLMDDEEKRAVEFMSAAEVLTGVTDDDIDWESLEGLPREMVARARAHLFCFPGGIYPYENGVAEVRWEINPDGRYYCDEDGFGMTPDQAVDLCGAIDRQGRVVRKFALAE